MIDKRRRKERQFTKYVSLSIKDSPTEIIQELNNCGVQNSEIKLIIKEGNEYYEREDTINSISSQRLINYCNTNWCPGCQQDGVDTACDGGCGRWLHEKCTNKDGNKRYCEECYY